MILASHGLIASQIASFDADAVAFFGRVTTAGGSLSATEKAAVNTLVVQMKADGTWTPMKAIYPMVGESAAACAQNLKSSSFTGTFSSGWTFASTGVTPNGTSAYMDTNFNAIAQSQIGNNTNFSVYVRNNNAGGYDFGGGVGYGGGYLISRYGSNLAYIGVSDNTYGTSVTSFDSRGLWSGGTNGSSAQILYRNGSSVVSGNSNISGFYNYNLFLGAYNGSGVPQVFANHEYSLLTISNGLNNTQQSNFYTAVQAFQTTLSRQV